MEEAYDGFSASYDALDGASFLALRRRLLSHAKGRVLEVAVGTGANLALYPSDGSVSRVDAVDLSAGMLTQARRKLPPPERGATTGSGAMPVELIQMDATSLTFADEAFDTVVDTFSLCVFPEPLACLKEMRRVCKADTGKVLLLEHARAQGNPVLAAYQDATSRPVAALGKGCVWNQDVPMLVEQAGLKIQRLERSFGGTIVLIEAVRSQRSPTA